MGSTTQSAKYDALSAEDQERKREELMNESKAWKNNLEEHHDFVEPIDGYEDKMAILDSLIGYFKDKEKWKLAVMFLDLA